MIRQDVTVRTREVEGRRGVSSQLLPNTRCEWSTKVAPLFDNIVPGRPPPTRPLSAFVTVPRYRVGDLGQ